MQKIDVKSIIIGVLFTILFMSTLGAYQTKVIQADKVKARSFQIVDAKGNVCGAFGASEEGDGILSMGSLLSKNQFSLYVTQRENTQGGNVVLKIKGERGELRITSGPYGDMGPVIYMSNQQGKGVMDLGISGNPGNGFLRVNLRDPNRVGVPPYKFLEGRPVMVFDDQGLLWASPKR